MNHDTDNLSLDALIDLIESNYGYGRTTGENEVKRVVAALHKQDQIIDIAANIAIAHSRGRLHANTDHLELLVNILRERGIIV